MAAAPIRLDERRLLEHDLLVKYLIDHKVKKDERFVSTRHARPETIGRGSLKTEIDTICSEVGWRWTQESVGLRWRSSAIAATNQGFSYVGRTVTGLGLHRRQDESVAEGIPMQLKVAESADETAIKPDCFGSLFPDLTQLEYNIPSRGKAFTARVTSLGIGVQHRELLADAHEWDQCQHCPFFRSCYDMSMAKLALGEAIKSL